MKLAGRKSVLNPGWFILLTVLRRCSRCWSYSSLLRGLFYETICFKSCLVLFCSCVFSVLLALRLPRSGKRQLILVLSVRLFDLCLFGFVCSLFLFVSWKGAACDCCTPWTFLLFFFCRPCHSCFFLWCI